MSDVPTTPVELALPDLVAIKSIIEAASSRGAFRANELVAVGTAYNKLAAFIEAASGPQSTKEQGVENGTRN